MSNLFIRVVMTKAGKVTVVYEQDISESDSVEKALRRFSKRVQHFLDYDIADKADIQIKEKGK